MLSGDPVIAGDDAGEGEGEDDSSAGGSSRDYAADVDDDDGNNSSIGIRTRGNSIGIAKSST